MGSSNRNNINKHRQQQLCRIHSNALIRLIDKRGALFVSKHGARDVRWYVASLYEEECVPVIVCTEGEVAEEVMHGACL